MTPDERINWMLAKRSAHAFIFGVDQPNGERTHFLYTKDEHDILNPKKPFPDSLYLRCVVDMCLIGARLIKPGEATYMLEWGFDPEDMRNLYETGLLAIEKSRQVMITWIMLAYVLWRAKFFEHQFILVQSKREDDAKQLVCVKEDQPSSARLTFMERSLPSYMQTMTTMTKCNVGFASNSRVWGIPQGGSIIRSHTPSLLFGDEAAFQPDFGEAYTATLPAVRGGGQAIFVSSAEVGAFQEICESKV